MIHYISGLVIVIFFLGVMVPSPFDSSQIDRDSTENYIEEITVPFIIFVLVVSSFFFVIQMLRKLTSKNFKQNHV